jgi:hypothetical protein
MKTDPDREALLDELLSESAPTGFREAMLRHSLAEHRLGVAIRRRRRQYVVTGVVAILAVTSAWVGLRHDPRERARGTLATIQPPVVAETPHVRLISDRELLDLFPQRPVGLVGVPGRQELVFLDEIH